MVKYKIAHLSVAINNAILIIIIIIIIIFVVATVNIVLCVPALVHNTYLYYIL